MHDTLTTVLEWVRPSHRCGRGDVVCVRLALWG